MIANKKINDVYILKINNHHSKEINKYKKSFKKWI